METSLTLLWTTDVSEDLETYWQVLSSFVKYNIKIGNRRVCQKLTSDNN